MNYKIAVILGDGIGLEVIPVAVRVLESLMDEGFSNSNLQFSFKYGKIGYEIFKKTGRSVTQEVLEMVRKSDAYLCGPTTTPPGIAGYKSAILTIRQALNLFANVRPIKSYPGVDCLRKDADLVIVRENTEGIYSGIGWRSAETAFNLRIITRQATENIAKYAFDLAMRRCKKLIFVTKSNVIRESCGLFREVVLSVAKDFPEVIVKERLVDSMAMELIRKTDEFDVILTPNLFGDILSDEAAALVGGLGLVPSANIGYSHALFQPVHGTAPDIAGKGVANPIAAVLSTKMMLDHFGEKEAADSVMAAVTKVLIDRKVLPYDLGGNSTTEQVANAIKSNL